MAGMTHVLDPDALPDDARALTAPLPPYDDVTRSDSAFRAFLHGLPGVDQVGAEARVGGAGHPLDQDDGEGLGHRHRHLDGRPHHARGRRHPRQGPLAWPPRPAAPTPSDPSCPQVAAVCVYGDLAGVAREALGDSGIHVAAVATAFPSGRASRAVKLADVEDAVANGADEIDMVIDRGAFLAGRYLDVYEEIVAVKEACGDAHLKVILETGELVTLDNVRRASWLAMLAGGDFIKTSTGKINPAATLPVCLVMLEAVRDFRAATGRQIGVKPAGGIRTTKDAIKHLVLINETVGPDWLDPDWFRFGASSLLNDLLLQRQKLRTGHYSGPDYVTVD